MSTEVKENTSKHLSKSSIANNLRKVSGWTLEETTHKDEFNLNEISSSPHQQSTKSSNTHKSSLSSNHVKLESKEENNNKEIKIETINNLKKYSQTVGDN